MFVCVCVCVCVVQGLAVRGSHLREPTLHYRKLSSDRLFSVKPQDKNTSYVICPCLMSLVIPVCVCVCTCWFVPLARYPLWSEGVDHMSSVKGWLTWIFCVEQHHSNVFHYLLITVLLRSPSGPSELMWHLLLLVSCMFNMNSIPMLNSPQEQLHERRPHSPKQLAWLWQSIG